MITEQEPRVDDDSLAECSEAHEEAAPALVEPSAAEKTLRQRIFRSRRSVLGLIVAGLVVIGALAATWQYLAQYRPDVETNTQVAEAVIDVAHYGTVALLSYSPDTLDRDFATAKSHLTGDFLSYYNEFSEQVVRPAATDKKVKTAAEVTRSALSELRPTHAKVLVFINQTTTSTDKPDPALTSSAVLVTLDKHGKSWLISGFDPV